MVDHPTVTPAISTHSTARGFKEGAKIIILSEHSGRGTQVRFFPSVHLLTGFATELYLKAFLIERGLSATELSRRPYGHNLDVMFAKAKELGLEASVEVATVVAHLNPGHSKYEYRYFGPTTEFVGTDYAVAFDCLDKLDFLVDEAVGASASFGMKPGH